MLKQSAVLGLLWISVVAPEVLAQKPPKCTDIPVRITLLANITATQVNRIYGDNANPNADTVYEDGVGNVYAKFQVCNSTNDLIINLNSTSRHMNFAFTEVLAAPGANSTPPSGTVQVKFSNINQVYEAPVESGGSVTLQTLHASSWTVSSKTTWFRFANPNAVGYQGGPLLEVANTPVNTSLINVSHPNCNTWFVSPDGDANASDPMLKPRAALMQQLKGNTYVSAGQYSMPYTIKVERLTPITCQ